MSINDEKIAVTNKDRMYISRCLQLARNGRGSTSPNPMVGAVVVCDDKIIGEGYHVRCGEAHAEVNAIRSVNDKSLLKKSVIYVSLEPCSHYGKTPPCAELIIKSGIPEVVIASVDSNAMVCGHGIALLRAAGVNVRVGVLENEALKLNRSFFVFHEQARPFVTLKWAQSADGFIDVFRENGKAQAVSNSMSLMAVHRLRAMHDAILIGRRTAFLDNPSLTLRHWPGRNPLRLVTDRHLMLPVDLKIFDGESPTVVYTEHACAERFEGKVLQVELDFKGNVVEQILSHLYSLKVGSLLVEGGSMLLQSFLDAGLWDEIRVEINPTLFLGNGVAAPVVPSGLKSCVSHCFGNVIKTYIKQK